VFPVRCGLPTKRDLLLSSGKGRHLVTGTRQIGPGPVMREQALNPRPQKDDSWYSFLLDVVCPRTVVRVEGLDLLRNPTATGLEPTAIRLAAQCLEQLSHFVSWDD
jgi:hypothetical protein